LVSNLRVSSGIHKMQGETYEVIDMILVIWTVSENLYIFA